MSMLKPEYYEICHQPEPDIVLWIYNGNRVKTKSTKACNSHNLWYDSEWNYMRYDCSGRVDIKKKVGSIALPSDIKRKKSRIVVDAVVDKFPNIMFKVFYDDDLSRGMSVQEFWEATE